MKRLRLRHSGKPWTSNRTRRYRTGIWRRAGADRCAREEAIGHLQRSIALDPNNQYALPISTR